MSKPPITPFLLRLSLGVLLCGAARAEFLDGRLVDANGQGVASASIAVLGIDGADDPSTANTGTDANGYFHVTVDPAGTYDVQFRPPQPPATSLLPLEVGSLGISGTTNVGDVTLATGAAISGRIVDASSVGVFGVDFDAVLPDGTSVYVIHDSTDAAGNFSFAIPIGPVELEIDPTAVLGQTLAPSSLELDLDGDATLGDLVLPPGFVVSGLLRNPLGQAVSGADSDTFDSSSGVQLFTPADDSNASGFVDFVVPAGTYDIEFCAPFALHLAGIRLTGVVVTANKSLGILTLPNGVVLSGHVQDGAGAPIAAVDVNLFHSGTGAPVAVCYDDTDASGNYAVNVPTGTFDVVLTPIGSAYGGLRQEGITVAGPTTVDGTLPDAFTSFCFGDGSLATPCPCGNFGLSGRGCENSVGSGGALLVAGGATHPDSVVLTASGETPSGLSIFLQGNGEIATGAVFGDGVRCVGGSLKRIAVRNAVSGTVVYPLPGDASISSRSALLGDPIATGSTRAYQTYYRDPSPSFCAAPPGNSWNVGNAVRIAW